MVKGHLFLTFFALLLLQAGSESRNYVILSTTKHGLRELRLSFRGRLLLETTIGGSSSPSDDLALVQVADENKLVEVFLRQGVIQDCIVKSSKQDMRSFRSECSAISPEGTEASLDELEMAYHSSTLQSPSKTTILPPWKTASDSTDEIDDPAVSKVHQKRPIDSSDADNKTLNTNFRDNHIAAFVPSLRKAPFLRKYQHFLKVRRQARLCREFYQRNEVYIQSVLQANGTEGTNSTSSDARSQILSKYERLHRQSQHLSRQHRHRHHHSSVYSNSSRQGRLASSRYSPAELHSELHNLSLGTPQGAPTQTDTESSLSHEKRSPDSLNEKEIRFNDSSTRSFRKEDKTFETEVNANSTEHVNPPEQHFLSETSPVSIDGVHNAPHQRLIDKNDSESARENGDFSNQMLNGTNSQSGKFGVSSNLTSSDHEALSRAKRNLLSGWVIFPGTKWCGDGDIARHKNDLGYHEALDSCCRQHDLCPMVIYKLSWNYGIFNYRLHTMSHCRCDRKFRKCLQAANTPLSYLIGRIYFNVIGPKCFKFKQETACVERYWWGACKRWDQKKVAYPKRQRKFKYEGPNSRKWNRRKKNRKRSKKHPRPSKMSNEVLQKDSSASAGQSRR